MVSQRLVLATLKIVNHFISCKNLILYKKEVGKMKTWSDYVVDESVSVDISPFENAHGKKPKGDGNWFFSSKPRGYDYKNKKEVFEVSGKFSDALKKAKAWADENNHYTVYVLS